MSPPFGSGGIGEVYRAHDTRLDRDVAIKILTEAVAADAEPVARFQREGKVLASLNHPHIAAIYGLEESDGVKALVVELVDGEDLAQRVARGALPLDEGQDDDLRRAIPFYRNRASACSERVRRSACSRLVTGREGIVLRA